MEMKDSIDFGGMNLGKLFRKLLLPTLVGMVSGAAGDNLKTGVLAGVIFPVILLAGIAVSGKTGRKRYINWLKNKKPGYQL